MSEGAPSFDLQSHSRHSDGELEAAGVVAVAASAGVELLALTDHDTVGGVRQAAAEAGRLGIQLAIGVEISALDEGGSDLHILGYLVDYRDPNLLDRLECYRQDRERRTDSIVTALRELGFEVDDSVLRARRASGKTIGRPHIARAVVEHPANAVRLAEAGLLEPGPFLEAYLIEGRPGFRPRLVPSIPDAITAIHEAGGVAIWAHPFWDISEPSEVLMRLDRFGAAGIDGVECFYLTHSATQTALLAERCAELGMLTTGSSDFHGPHHPQMSAFRAFSTYGYAPNLGPIAQAGRRR